MNHLTHREWVERIIAAVCEVCDITPAMLVSRCRKREISKPRHILRYLLYKHVPGITLVNICHVTGNADHSTVIHSRNMIANLVSLNAYGKPYDREISELVRLCEERIERIDSTIYAPKQYPMAGVI